MIDPERSRIAPKVTFSSKQSSACLAHTKATFRDLICDVVEVTADKII